MIKIKKRILIAGYYGFRNTGDEAILSALLNDLRSTGVDLQICVLSGDPEGTKRLHRINAIPQSDIQAIIEQARISDYLIVGGGGVFQDYWGADKNSLLTSDHAGIPFYSCLPLLGWLLEKPVLLYAVGVGPLFSQEAKNLTRLSFELATSASVRDRESLQLLASIGLAPRKIHVAADSSFNIAADTKRARKVFQQVSLDTNRPLVAICLRNWEVPGSQTTWQTAVANSLDAFFEQTNCFFLFIPFQDLPAYPLTDDISAAQDVIRRMKHQHELALLQAGLSPETIYGIISKCELVVGMRYHSIVFAAGMNVPAIGLSYDDKVANLIDDLGLGDYIIKMLEVNSDRLSACMHLAWTNRQSIRRNLPGKVGEIKRATRINQKALKNLIEGENKKLPDAAFVEGYFKEFILNQSALLDDRKQAIQSCEDLVLLGKQTIQGLNKQIREKDRAIERYTDQIENQNRSIYSLEQGIQTCDDQVLLGKQTIQGLNKQIREKDRAIKRFTDQIENHARRIHSLDQKFNLLQEGYQERTQEVQALTRQLLDIADSTAWKLTLSLWGVRKFILPHGSMREKMAIIIWKGFRQGHLRRERVTVPIIGKLLNKVLNSPPFPFKERYVIEDNTQVTLYTDDSRLLPEYENRKPLQNDLPDNLQVSLIASLKDEAKNIEGWLQCIQDQTRTPDEIVVIDGGSSDGSDRIFEKASTKLPFPVKLIRAPGANMATARNLAIAHACYPIIAVTDFGCHPVPDWLEKLIQPFKLEPETMVSAGFYETIDRRGKSLSGKGLWPSHNQIYPRSFLPSSRSVVFRREALEAVGGHPEWLTRTGDDTYLDLELKRLGGKWAFVPESVVKWIAPDTLLTYLRKMFEWATGDGESGVHAIYYWRYLLCWCGWLILMTVTVAVALGISFLHPHLFGLSAGLFIGLWLGTLLILALKEDQNPVLLIQKSFGQAAQVLGFLKGASNRVKVEERRIGTIKGVFFVLSGVPIDDTGGGARSTQFATELLRLGYSVVFIHKFPKDESRELSLQFSHPNLFQYSIKDFQLKNFAKSHSSLLNKRAPSVIVEFPLPDFLEILKALRQDYKATIIYDLIDDWKTSLGAHWYTPRVEEEIIALSHFLVGTVPFLAERLEATSERKSLLLPNAVNDRLFNPDLTYARPLDLPETMRIVIYIGALWGEWFDWRLLNQTARKYPNAAFVLIGDYRNNAKQLAPNVHLLGLKAQRDLPAYLAHANVAILPWKVNAITQATSPLKVYEYLAMRLPVVAPRLNPLEQIPGIYLARDQDDFIELVGTVSKDALDQVKIAAFIGMNNWSVRINTLIKQIMLSKDSPIGK